MQAPTAARGFVDELQRAYEFIKRNPDAGSPRLDLGRPEPSRRGEHRLRWPPSDPGHVRVPRSARRAKKRKEESGRLGARMRRSEEAALGH